MSALHCKAMTCYRHSMDSTTPTHQAAWQPIPFTHLGFQVMLRDLKVSCLMKLTRNLFTDNLFIEWWWTTNINDLKARKVTTTKCCMDSIQTWRTKELFSRTCKTVCIVTASLWFLYGYSIRLLTSILVRTWP